MRVRAIAIRAYFFDTQTPPSVGRVVNQKRTKRSKEEEKPRGEGLLWVAGVGAERSPQLCAHPAILKRQPFRQGPLCWGLPLVDPSHPARPEDCTAAGAELNAALRTADLNSGLPGRRGCSVSHIGTYKRAGTRRSRASRIGVSKPEFGNEVELSKTHSQQSHGDVLHVEGKLERCGSVSANHSVS